MEGVAAFSVACNVMQTIHFSMAAVKLCKDLYKGSSPDEDLESHCASLRQAAASLLPAGLTTTTADPKLEQQLQKVMKDLISTADNIQKELDKLKISSQRSRLHSAKNTARYTLRTKSKIDGLHSSLERSKNVMETQVLIGLSNRTVALQGALQAASTTTNTQLRDILKHLQDGQTTIENLVDSKSGEIVNCVHDEHEKTRTHMATHHEDATQKLTEGFHDIKAHTGSSMDSHRLRRLADHRMETFLQSLKYEGMNDRQNGAAVNRTHRNTFQWILQDDLDDGHSFQCRERGPQNWSNFVEWLTGEHKLYWISGKPASGKSNLMRYLTTNPKTMTYLERWRPKVRILCAYIWLAGTENQRNQRCLVASLLFQLLSSDPKAKEDLYNEYTSSSKRDLADWSLKELERCLTRALQPNTDSNSNGVCIFIDGLDEIDANPNAAGGKSGLIELLERLSIIPYTKLCVASREENVFRDAYSNFPRLRLQDLNRADILEYVKTACRKTKPDLSIDLTEEKINNLVGRIAWRADGVFLWASVVVSNIIRARLENSDEFQQLERRINQLPSDLSKLYTEMWGRLNPDDKNIYQAQSALYFRLVLESQGFGLSQLGALICANPEFARRLFRGGPCPFTDDFLRRECQTFERQIHARCAGLLQISPPSLHETLTTSLLGYFKACTISFVHRSAVDWFQDNSDVRPLLQHEQRSSQELLFRVELERIAVRLTEITPRVVLQHVIGAPLDLLDPQDLRLQLESEYLDFVIETIRRSPLGSFLTTDLHTVEVGVWSGALTCIRKYMNLIHSQGHQQEAEIQSRILSWLCCRLWDITHALDRPHDDRSRDLAERILTLVSALLSNNSGLDPFHVDNGLRYLYDYSAIVQPAIVSFLLAYNHCLETEWKLSPTLHAAFLDALYDFLKYKDISGFGITVNIGQGGHPGNIAAHGNCWLRFSELCAMNSNVILRVKMPVSQIFRYSRVRMVKLKAFNSLPTDKQSLIKASLGVPERPLGGERLTIRHESFENKIYSTVLDPETLNIGIQLAEDGYKAVFSNDPEDHHFEGMDATRRRRFDDLWKKTESDGILIYQRSSDSTLYDPAFKKIKYGREVKDLNFETPEVSLSEIDWSEKPQYSILDKALKKLSIKPTQTPTENY